MARKPRPEQQQPGEDLDGFRERRGPWDAMVRAGVPFKTARSHVETALADLQRQQRIESGPWYGRELPASQRARVAAWEQALTRALADLAAIDIDAWQPEMRREIALVEETDA